VRTRADQLVFSADAGVVQVMVTVTDEHGQFVKGLARQAFRVYEDGRPQPVVHFDDPSAPRELVAALDMSASMLPAMPRLRTAVKAFLGRVRPVDKLTLLAFNDGVFSLARREVDPAARQRAVDRLAAWGGTALYDTLLQGLDLTGRQKGRKALVVFSDGEDTASLSTAADVERRVRTSDAPLYVIAQGRGQEVAALRELVGQLARLSGGRAFYTNDIDELGAAFDQIAEELDAQYLLAYEPDNTARDGTWRGIRVELPELPHSVRAREGYRAEAPQP
jgi:VWFA-related protein